MTSRDTEIERPDDELPPALVAWFKDRADAIRDVAAHRASPPEYPGLALVPVALLDRLARYVEPPRSQPASEPRELTDTDPNVAYDLGYEKGYEAARSQSASEPSLDVAWKAAEAALPLAGWMSADGRWVLPSGVWDINVRRFPASGDNVTEPYYPDMYEATATVSPNKRFAGTPEESPAAALQALAARLSQPTEPSETDQE